MVEGTFVKNGEITEVVLPNGFTEITSKRRKKELQAFTFMPKRTNMKKAKKKRKKKWQEVLILASLFMPMLAFTAAILELVQINGFVVLFILGWVWDGLVLYANREL